MLHKYDKDLHGKSKLGMYALQRSPRPATLLVVPAAPIAAQVNTYGVIHIMIDGGMYLTGAGLMSGCCQSDPKAVKAAIDQAFGQGESATEPSYSQTGSVYVKLGVTTEAESLGGKAVYGLTLAGLSVAKVIVDPNVVIESTDDAKPGHNHQSDDSDDDGPTTH